MTSAIKMATIRLIHVASYLQGFVRDRITSVRACRRRDCRLHRAGVVAHRGAVVAQRAEGFRGLRRSRREGEEQGREDLATRRLQCQIRRTAEEQKKIDQQYTAYLDSQRRDNIANAFAAKQQQEVLQPAPLPAQQGIQKVAVRTDTDRVPVPVASPVKQAARIKAAQCAKDAFSCEWPRLSQSLDDLKRLFSPSPPAAKAKRS